MVDSAVDDVKSRLAIEDVVGEYVELKRAGRNFKGLSPFNSEKTPSFIVSPEKQIWHDFSSGKGGDIFSFVMEMEGLDFKGALEVLARKAGVELSQYRSSNYAKNAQLKERLYDCLSQATRFYQLCFKKDKSAVEYVFKERAINKETALDFKIGYAPSGGSELTNYLLSKNFTIEEVKKAGLGHVYARTPKDMFKDRIMIPLMDSSGRVIGFTARLFNKDENSPKYINTPQTILYDKSRHVFGLHLAKNAIRTQNFAVVVEGNMDVIASHQAGVKNVVATAGTAMTKDHLKEISRYSGDIRLCFDNDSAGRQATERTIILAVQSDINLNVIDINGEKDPDELIQTNKNLWIKSISNYKYSIDWLINYYSEKSDLTTAKGKKDLIKQMLPIINKMLSKVEQEHYVLDLSKTLGVSIDSINSQLNTKNSYKSPLKKPKASFNELKNSSVEKTRLQNQFLSLLLYQPSLRIYMKFVEPKMFGDEKSQKMYEIIEKYQKNKYAEIITKIQNVQSLTDYGKILILLYEELYANLDFVELDYEIARLQARIIENYIKEQKIKITSALNLTSNEQDETKLLEQVKNLDQLLKNAKEITNGKR